jgi:hypothetical protein
MANLDDLTGKTFGRLTVIKRAGSIGENACWLCQCTCGNLKVMKGCYLKRGIKSCGCLRREFMSVNGKRKFEHGYSATKLHRIWRSMIYRCNSAINDKSYKNYRARGIKVCDEWLDFLCFRNWAINNGYDDRLSIERKDVNGNYEPDNCTWIPLKEQNSNRRTTHYVEINGVVKPIATWAREFSISPSVMYQRIKRGWVGKDLLKPAGKGVTENDSCK